MQINVITLEIPFQFGEVADAIYPVVLMDGQDTILVDCGYCGFLPLIESALIEQGICPSSLTKIVLTHHDHDHIGALHDFKAKYPHIQIIASRAETPYIDGTLTSLRLEQAQALQDHLPEDQKAFGEQFIAMLRAVKPVSVDCMVSDGDKLPWCGGCSIIATPGHTPGHISLYLSKYETFIAGDAMVLEHGLPVIANPEFALDKEAANASLSKLLQCGATKIICYHGGEYLP